MVQARAADAENQLTDLAFEHTGALPAQRAEDLLKRARTLNPDRMPDLFEGGIRAKQDRPQEAIAAIQRVTAAEPENAQAWNLLATVAKDSDPQLYEQARARVRALAPPVE